MNTRTSNSLGSILIRICDIKMSITRKGPDGQSPARLEFSRHQNSRPGIARSRQHRGARQSDTGLLRMVFAQSNFPPTAFHFRNSGCGRTFVHAVHPDQETRHRMTPPTTNVAFSAEELELLQELLQSDQPASSAPSSIPRRKNQSEWPLSLPSSASGFCTNSVRRNFTTTVFTCNSTAG